MSIKFQIPMSKTQRLGFSIIIPTYNRPTQLLACLEAISRLNYPQERFEVIVVDDGSGTLPENVVTAFTDRLQIRLLTQANAGPAAARNTGIISARGNYLAFTDDDCLPDPDWLVALERRCTKTPDHMIGGKTINSLPDNPYAVVSQMIIDAVYEYYNTNPNRTGFFATNNMAVAKEQFLKIGGFDPHFRTSEDREVCNRWSSCGYQMTYAPEAKIYHAHQLTWIDFWRQHFNYGCGAFRFHQLRAQRQAKPMTLEHRSFYRHLLTYPFLRPQPRSLVMLVTLLIVSQIASTAGFLWEYGRQRNMHG